VGATFFWSCFFGAAIVVDCNIYPDWAIAKIVIGLGGLFVLSTISLLVWQKDLQAHVRGED